jgi:hypothetical protein
LPDAAGLGVVDPDDREDGLGPALGDDARAASGGDGDGAGDEAGDGFLHCFLLWRGW